MRFVQFINVRRLASIRAISIVIVGAFLALLLSNAAAADPLLKELASSQPNYPRIAWQDGLSGHVTLSFDVSKRGKVLNPSITASTQPGVFDLYALQAVKEHRYEHLGSSRQLIEGVTKSISFTLDSKPKVYHQPEYPLDALATGREGFVVVEFDVRANGKVRKPLVAGAFPPNVFDRFALSAVAKFEFEPERFMPKDTVQHKITFSLNSNPQASVFAEYPSAAREQGLEGRVVVEFDINSEGMVDNAKAVYSSSAVFETPAIEAVAKFTFNPDQVAENVLHKIDFILDREHRPLTKSTPEYPRQAAVDEIEGYVIVRFDINEIGTVENLSVLEAKPDDIFNDAALAAASKFTYLPRYVDGKPERVPGVLNKLVFKLSNPIDLGQNRTLNNQRGNQNQPRGGFDRARRIPDLPPDNPEQQPAPKHNVRLKPLYTMYLEGNLQDGAVIVEFDVNERGHVEKPNVLEVHDTNLTEEITESILEQVSYFWYAPFVENQRPVRVSGVRHRIDLRFRED